MLSAACPDRSAPMSDQSTPSASRPSRTYTARLVLTGPFAGPNRLNSDRAAAEP